MNEVRIALRNVGHIDPMSIEDYIKVGGYEALKKARTMDRGELIVTIEETSRLRGRGGAAFPTGKKWSSAFKNDSEVKYIVCNADEGEPGTYKDRVIMEGDPHTVIEGILIGAYAVGAKECFIYVRGEYENSIKLLRNAVKQAEEKGLCGDTVIRVVSGAGAYVCGEGTAIVNSLEGVRGEPRLKPPSMVRFTFAIAHASFLSFASKSSGKSFSALMNADVANKVCVEVPTNATLRDVVEGFGGGVANGKKLKAIQLGGSSCGFVTPDQLDTPIDFDSIRAIGASLGSGAVYVIDETRNIVDILAEIAKFYRHESCGKCSPCREGTMRIAEFLEKFAKGEGSKADIDLIESMSDYMRMSCFCPLGQSATTAFMSALKLFPEDFDAKLRKEA